MGIYSANANLSYGSSILDESTVDESLNYEPTLEGAFQVVAENEENWTNFMKGVGIAELNYYEEHGAELPYNEAAGSGFFEKAKGFFKKAWEKIKALFKRFFSMFDSITKSNKEFIKKYQKDLLKVTGTDKFKYKGYKFTLNGESNGTQVKIQADIANTDYQSTSDNAKLENDYDETDWADGIRGKVLNSTNKITSSEFTKELFEAYRNGESKKEEIEGVQIGEIIQYLGGEDLKKKAERDFKTLKRSCEDAIRTAEKGQKELINGENPENKSDQIAAYSRNIAQRKIVLSILQVANGAHIAAIKAKSAQYKAICSKLLTYRPKNESAEFGGDSFNESGLFNVKFI